jgi:xylan 1,4-beta-xylosidase
VPTPAYPDDLAPVTDARTDFETRIYQRLTDTSRASEGTALPPPANPVATGAIGHIRLSWDPVEGAAGYVIERAEGDRPAVIVDHGGSDVPAVPGTSFADTGRTDGVDYTYRVGAVAGAEYPVWQWSEPVTARTRDSGAGDPVVDVVVDAQDVIYPLKRVWELIGSERLSQLRLTGDQQWIADEFATALRRAHDDLGVRGVRAHAILHDDNAVVTVDGTGTVGYDLDRIDAIYDQILEIGIRPIVELSFMPAALARDPQQTVFTYRGIISPPADWAQWRALIDALARHLISRYGIDEVATWPFEVWNEPNLVVFWTGTVEEYLRLYDETAAALKGVDERLLVGGPSTAASEWIERLAAHAEATGAPLDFVTSHTYGNMPVHARPAMARHGFGDLPVWWTEWGVGSTHFGPIHDTVFGAPFVLSGYAAAQDHLDALAYWVVSDHFEELGRPERLFHNGFGLLTVGNLGKPRYWAAHLAAHLGDRVLASSVTGDGAGVLVQAWSTAHDDGTIDVLVWNGTVNAALMAGDPRLDRDVRLSVSGLRSDVAYTVDLARIDEQHSSIASRFPADDDWPDPHELSRLRHYDELARDEMPLRPAGDDTAALDFRLPMPGVARIRLHPVLPKENR